MKIVKLNDETKRYILTNLLKRNPGQYTEYENTVNEILNEVRTKGDQALFAYTEKFDHCKLDAGTVRVTKEEIEEAFAAYDQDLIRIMEDAKENIVRYHEKQVQNSWFTTKDNGIFLGQKVFLQQCFAKSRTMM